MANRQNSDVKHIIVVDDHFEMLEFLRSMLELADHDYEVLAVPSAEESMLELRRSHFDLLITDVRLPGMSGFDLVRRMRKIGRDIPVIMITAYSSPQGKKEAADLGVYRYFRKPLDTDEVLTAVNNALYGAEKTAPAQPSIPDAPVPVSQSVRKRLELLRTDTGAMHLTLTTAQGQIALALGHVQQRYNPDGLAQLLTQNMINSFHLADQIGSRKPYTFQYHRGHDVDLYCASVGRDHYLTMFFDAHSRRGRIGTIWVFTQRATKDLLELLSEDRQMMPEQPTAASTSLSAGTPESIETPPIAEPPAPFVVEEEPTPSLLEEDRVLPTAIKERPPRTTPKIEPELAPPPESEPEPILEEPTPVVDPDYLDIDPAELEALLGSAANLDTDDLPDLDEFWDSALEEGSDDASSSLSFEEAMQRGLISLDIDEEA